MRVVGFALAVVAALALQHSARASPPTPTVAAPMQTTVEGENPAFKPQTFPARGDALDEWCKAVKTGSMIAVCSDDQLRALAIERLRAFDEAISRLPADQQKLLAADQNGWALSYPQGCGVWSNVPPPLPIAPEVRECMAKAGQARLVYLRAYGGAAAGGGSAPVPPAKGSPETAVASATPAPPSPGAPVALPQPPGAMPGDAAPPPVLTPPPPRGSRLAAESSTANPLASRTASFGPLQGTAAIGVILVALVTIGLWIWAVLRSGRRRAQDQRRLDAASLQGERR